MSFFDGLFGKKKKSQTAIVSVSGVRTQSQSIVASSMPNPNLKSKVANATVSQQQKSTSKFSENTSGGSAKDVTKENYYGSFVFEKREVESVDDLMQINFARVINSDVKMGQHLYNRIAVVRFNEASTECAIFVDKQKSSGDESDAIIELLKNSGYKVVKGYFATSTIIISMSQGHLNGDLLKNAREISRDPTKNALFQSFSDIIGWAYDNKADDIDFAVFRYETSSQVAFKIGGRYIRPPRYLIQTETMIQMLGIAWQRSGGGSSPTFEMKYEQQAQITMDLPRTKIRPGGAKIRLRWSGMAIDKGTVVTLRLQRLGESAIVKSLNQAGYLDYHMDIFRRAINSEGGMVCFAGVVGSGKSTSLAQLLGLLPDHLKIQSIEDPVELEIPRAYQKTVARDLLGTGPDKAFMSAARAIYRSALDVLYLGEIRDTETGGIARQVAESGHTVYTTTHARSGLGIIDRFVSPQIGIPREVLGAPDIIKLLVYQALLPVNCPHCSKSPADFLSAYPLSGVELDRYKQYWARLERIYKVDSSRYRLRDPHGCSSCRKEELPELNGFNGRSVVCEMVEPDEDMSALILDGAKLKIYQHWRSLSDKVFDSDNFSGKTAMECSIYKATKGIIDPREIESRFTNFETIELKSRKDGGSCG